MRQCIVCFSSFEHVQSGRGRPPIKCPKCRLEKKIEPAPIKPIAVKVIKKVQVIAPAKVKATPQVVCQNKVKSVLMSIDGEESTVPLSDFIGRIPKNFSTIKIAF